jgi:formylglycine-generating enzyme required for sulfatase activity
VEEVMKSLHFIIKPARLVSAAAAAALLFAAHARSETALVSEFSVTSDVVLACDIESEIAKRLTDLGCNVVFKADAPPPDIAVSGEYWVSGPNVFATIVVTDTVVGKTVFGRNVFIPSDEELCVKTAVNFVDAYAMPQNLSTHKENIRDTATGMEFVFVPGGYFVVDNGGKKRREFVDSFLIGKFEVTQKQWTGLMGSNPSKFTESSDLPVENVSWYEAMDFVKVFREKTGLAASLPSELQWEYAARARGRSWRWAGTNNEDEVCDYAWTRSNSGDSSRAVGTKKANGLGLYDMSGNLAEWCEDLYQPRSTSDPDYEPEKKYRVIRGGSWMTTDMSAMTSARDGDAPGSRYSDNGFRLIISLKSFKK